MPQAARVAPRTGAVNAIQITDTHVYADPGERYDGLDTLASLNAVIDAILLRDESPDFVLATGDLVNDPGPASYRRLSAVLQRLPAPVYCLAGNHDDPELLAGILDRANMGAPRLVECGDWRVALLNTCVPGREGGRLAHSELEFLEASLKAGRRHVLVCLHHPPVPVGSPWMDAMGLENGETLFRILDAHPQVRGVLWGHIHQQFDGARANMRLLGTPSTCVQFTPGADHYLKADAPPAYRVLRLNPDGRIETEVVPVPL